MEKKDKSGWSVVLLAAFIVIVAVAGIIGVEALNGGGGKEANAAGGEAPAPVTVEETVTIEAQTPQAEPTKRRNPARPRKPARPHRSQSAGTCEDVTSYDYNWDNDMKCTRSDGSIFYTDYYGAERFETNGDE